MEKVYSRIPELDEYIIKKLNELGENGFFIDDTIELEYGTKFIFYNKAGTKVPVVIYYNNKTKKLSIVNELKGNDELKDKMNGILRSGINIKDEKFYRPFDKWIGTDEAGKGDYFGPLVTAGFYADKDIIGELETIGVSDSKNFSVDGIHSISEKLLKKFTERTAVFEILPEKYNEIIEKQKNTNVLLAWCHVKVIYHLTEIFEPDGVIIDKFGYEKYIQQQIDVNPKMEKIKKLKIIQRHKAEENLAVAAASIIAREKYLRRMDEYSKQYGFKIPRGANEGIKKTINLIKENYGENELRKIAKVHFKIKNQK